MLHKLKSEIKDYISHLKLFKRNIILFLSGGFFIGFSMSVYRLMYNLYLKEIGFKEGFIGNVLSIRSLGSALLILPLAYFMPGIKIRKILFTLPILFLFSILIQTFMIEPYFILAGGFIMGFVFGAYMLIGAPYYMRNSGEKERTYIFSISFALMLASGFIGNIFSGFLYKISRLFIESEILRYRFVLTLGAVLCLVSLFFFFSLSKSSTETVSKHKFDIEGFPVKFMAKIALPQFIIGLGAGMIIPFLNLFFKDVWQISPERLGVLFAVSQIFMFVGILLGPVMKKYLGMVKAVVITQIISIPFMYLLGFSHLLWIVILSFFLRATLMNMSQPLIKHFTMESVNEKFHYLANGIVSVCWRGAWILSAWFGGKIIEKFGFSYVFLATMVLYFLSSVLYYIFFIWKKKAKISA